MRVVPRRSWVSGRRFGVACAGAAGLVAGCHATSPTPGPMPSSVSVPPNTASAPGGPATAASAPGGTASAGGTPSAAVSGTPTQPCARLVASGTVKGSDVRVCIDEQPGDEPSLTFHLEDGAGRRLLADDMFMSFRPDTKPAPKAFVREVDGDGIEDVLVESGMWDLDVRPWRCRYVVEGSRLGKAEAEGDGGPIVTVDSTGGAMSFAAAVAIDKDPWASVASAATPIPKADACALVGKARVPGGFATVATKDAEIVDYFEPGSPHCLDHLAARGLTKERLAGIEAVDCESLECSTTGAVCWNHHPDPAADYYLFAKSADGRWKIRAIALYAGS